MKHGQKIYYTNETDDVLKEKIKPIKIDEKYKYNQTNPVLKLISGFTYRFLATPLAFIYFKIFKKIKFHNAHVLKPHKKEGYFIYANHSNQFGDGFCPALICFPKKPHIIVNPVNVCIPVVGKIIKMWGAIPTPDTIDASKNFYKKIENTLKDKNPILIYPEAHLWPYYTRIRNFSNVSFRYPIKFKKPVFTFTTVYKLKKNNKKPKIEIYIDGPFYSNPQLSEKEQQQCLRDAVFEKLVERASLSDYEYVNYIKKEKIDD